MLLTTVNRNHNRMCCNNGKQITIFPPFGNHSVWKKKNILIFANNRVWFPLIVLFSQFLEQYVVSVLKFFTNTTIMQMCQSGFRKIHKKKILSLELTTIWESNRQQICCCSGSGLYILTIWTESPRIVRF